MKLNLSKILITGFSLAEGVAKMQAGKMIKKVTGEQAPEDGLVDMDTVIEALQSTVDSKASKFKEQAKELIAELRAGTVEEDWTTPNVKKVAGTPAPKKATNPNKDASKLLKIKVIAEEDGLQDILDIINS